MIDPGYETSSVYRRKPPLKEDSISVDKDAVTENLIGGEDFLSVLYRLASTSTDYTLLQCIENKEVYPSVREAVSSYIKSIPISGYFVQSTLKDKVLIEVLNNPVLYLYFRTLDHIFIQQAMSKLNMTYPQIVDKLMEYITPLTTTKRDMSILTDKQYIEQMVDINKAKEIIQHNSILLTIYCVKMAFPFSIIFDI